MQFKNYFKVQMPFIALTALAFVLSSCGSSQYAGTDNDGIYSSSEEPVERNTNVSQNGNNNNTYYKNYFKEKSTEYDYIQDENEVFTDIDSYESEYVEQDSTDQQYYAGWGQENDNEVVINVYSGFNNGWGGFYQPFWNRGWRWNNGWGWNYGWDWNYGLGFNYGWGWNAGFYSPYWCPPYGAYGYYGYPYNYGYYNNPYYSRNAVAFHNSRRGTTLGRMNNLGRRNTAITRNNISSTPRVRTRTRSNSTVTSEPRPRGSHSVSSKPRVRTRTNSSSPRPRVNTSTPRPRTRTNTYSPRPRTNMSSPRPSRSVGTSRGGRRR